MAGLKAPTFEEITADEQAPAFEDIAPLAPDPELEEQRRGFVLDQAEKTGISPAKLQRRQTLINQLFSDEEYEEAVTSRKEEYANAGASGVWAEFIDAEAQMSAKIGAAFRRAHAALVRFNPLGEPTAQEKAILEARAKRYEESANLLWEVAKNPDLSAEGEGGFHKAARLTGGTVPYITATTLAYTVAGPLGGFAVGGLVEGHSAYQEAIDAGVEETTARNIGLGVGIVNGAIESIGGKFTEEFFEKIIKKRVTDRIKQAGALFGLGTLVEALEEGSQEVATITGEEFYRDVNWKERLTRVAASMAGGAFLGGTMRGMQIAGKRLMNEKVETPELKAELTAAIQETTGLPVEEAQKVAQDAIDDKFHPELAEGEEKAETPAQPVEKAPSVPAAGQTGETGAVEAGPGAEGKLPEGYALIDRQAQLGENWKQQFTPASGEWKYRYVVTNEKGIAVGRGSTAEQAIQRGTQKVSEKDTRPDYLKRVEKGEGSLGDIQSVAGDILRENFGWPQRSAKSEAEYYEIDDDKRIRLAQHDVVYPESDVEIVISVGPSQDADIVIPDDVKNSGEIRDIIEKALASRGILKAEAKNIASTPGLVTDPRLQQAMPPQTESTPVGTGSRKARALPIIVRETKAERQEKSEKIPAPEAQQALAKGEGEKAPVEPGAKPVEEGPERKVSRAAQRIQEEAIAKDLTESLGELPTYEMMSMQEQASMAAAEIEKDYENAKQMAYGKIAPPSGLRPASIYRAVAVKARNEADVETLRNLAVVHPQISLELTAMGQAIKAADVGTMADPVKAMQDVQKAKEKAVAKRKKIKDIPGQRRKMAKEAKVEIHKAVTHRQSWSEFVSSIRC